MNRERAIFKRASSTFFTSSLFFPAAIRRDVFDLYSFVRTADNYVDQVPADSASFYSFRRIWAGAAANPGFNTTKQIGDSRDVRAVKNMLRVARKHNFDMDWIESFLDAMQADLTHKPCQSLQDTLRYMYGSAETVGLMMAKIMELSQEAASSAKMQGRAFQYINFIRDIEEDNGLSRCYFPASDLRRFNLPDLARDTAETQTEDFTNFIHFQLARYVKWQQEARAGYRYIPKRLRIPVQTAADMFEWTAREIYRNPMIVYERKIKPTKLRVLGRLLTNMV